VNALNTSIGTTHISGVRYLRAATLLLVFLFLAVGFVIGAMRVANAHRTAIEDARRTVNSALQLLQTYTGKLICEAMMVAAGFGDMYRSELLSHTVDPEDLTRLMQSRLEQMTQVETFMLVDMDGRVITGKSRSPAIHLVSARAGCVELPPNPVVSFIGKPMAGWDPAAPERWVVPLGVLVGPQDNPVGYTIAVVAVDKITQFYNSVDIGQNGVVSLWTSDGNLIAGSSPKAGTAGSHNPAIKRIFAENVSGLKPNEVLISGPAASDAAEISGHAKVEFLPLMVSVSMDSADYLRGWRGTRNRMLISAVGILLAALAFVGIILSQLQRSRENEEALRNAKAVAEEANEAKSRFLAHMSHEFRTPLNAIMGFSDIIRSKAMGEPLAEVYVTYAGHIYRSGEHLLEIVNDVLDMAKIESGVHTLQPAPITVAAAIESAVSFLGEMAKAADLRVKAVIAPHLPQIMGDERFVRQVLINLISNAVKFSPPHGEVVVRAALTDDDHIDISVIDHGPGIEPIILKRVGEPFLQGNPTLSRAGQGTGLGLSICKHYMELMGGALLVESILGAGTTVTMRFPKELRCKDTDLENATT
jgi:signal transduction histidine kinase